MPFRRAVRFVPRNAGYYQPPYRWSKSTESVRDRHPIRHPPALLAICKKQVPRHRDSLHPHREIRPRKANPTVAGHPPWTKKRAATPCRPSKKHPDRTKAASRYNGALPRQAQSLLVRQINHHSSLSHCITPFQATCMTVQVFSRKTNRRSAYALSCQNTFTFSIFLL